MTIRSKKIVKIRLTGEPEAIKRKERIWEKLSNQLQN